MSNRPLICAFVKVRNEIIREGNIYRLLANLDQYVDAAVICDDASSDGTDQVIEAWMRKRAERVQHLHEGRFVFMRVPREHQDFKNELAVKQQMIEQVNKIEPEYVLWMDGDQ